MAEIQTVEQITRQAPFMEDYIRKLLESAYQRVGEPVDIPAQQVAGLTPDQLRAQELVQQGIGGYQSLLGEATGMLQDPTAYRQYMSPYEEDVIGKVGEDIARQTQIQKGILGGSAVGAGAFGGAREGVARGEIAGAGLREFGRQAAGLREQGFRTAQDLVGRRAQGLGQFAALGQQLGQQDVANLLGIGSLEQQQAQAVLDAQRATALQQQYEPYQRLGFFSDILRGVPTSSSTIGISTSPSQSPLSQVAGIAATGLGLAGQLGYKPFV